MSRLLLWIYTHMCGWHNIWEINLHPLPRFPPFPFSGLWNLFPPELVPQIRKWNLLSGVSSFVCPKFIHFRETGTWGITHQRKRILLHRLDVLTRNNMEEGVHLEWKDPQPFEALPTQTGWGQETQERKICGLYPDFYQLTWAGRSKTPGNGGHVVGQAVERQVILSKIPGCPHVAQSSRGYSPGFSQLHSHFVCPVPGTCQCSGRLVHTWS